MRRIILFFSLMFAIAGTVMAQQMTDDQIIEYVKSANQAGKNQQQIAAELMRRGVTREQVERLRAKYEKSEREKLPTTSQDVVRSRARVDEETVTQTELSQMQGGILQDADSAPEDQPRRAVASSRRIFGHNIFTNPNLTFEPNTNMATPIDYRLGPGDEVIIDVWGASETTIRETISPEGSILVSNLGPVYLSGKTVKEANEYLKDEFTKIYSGVSGDVPNTQVKLTLGEIRSIQVNVMGEVAVPGTYTLSSFASVFHALYRAGGVNEIGSLRSIRVVREGSVIADLDVYDFILEGKMKDDIRLQDGDVILVQPYQLLVEVQGKVKRPMFYELKPGETASLLLDYAGGFTGMRIRKPFVSSARAGVNFKCITWMIRILRPSLWTMEMP